MATTKKTTAKKAAPAKRAVVPKKATKSAVKAPAKKAAPAKKTAAPKKATKSAAKTPVKKVASVKKSAASKKAIKPAVKTPAKKAASVKKTVATKKVAAKVVTKVAPVKKAAVKKEQLKPPKVVVPKLSTKTAVKYQPDFTKSVLDAPKIEKAKSVVRYSDSELQEFKDIILKKLDAAKKELTYLQGLITRRDESGDLDEGRYMTMEDGSVSMEREQLSQLASRQITFIDHLEKALVRVENKTYGICRVTGKLIEKARLRAVPHATLSMEAKSGMNR